MHRPIVLPTLGILLLNVAVAAQTSPSPPPESAFLWVVDQNTGLGVAGASVAIGPGNACVGLSNPVIPNWTAHYVTDRVGRAYLESLPSKFSCRVELNGRVLEVVSAGSTTPWPWAGPRWMQLEHASQISLTVEYSGPTATEDDLNYWEHTSDPSRFRSYIQDLNNGQLLANVTIIALRSGIKTSSDENGLFTLDIPKSYRQGVSPPGAMETLVFTKAGYRRFEYRNLILQPGLNWLTVYLEKGSGTVVRENFSARNSGDFADAAFFELKEGEKEIANKKAGKILSLTIAPSTYEGGWIVCTERGAKAIVKARNLRSVEIFWYSTGTGIGFMPPARAGPMKKVSTSTDGDIWEIAMPDLMATNFWAQGTDLRGQTVKSMDLGNVGWDIAF